MPTSKTSAKSQVALSSMTGFARAEGAAEGRVWAWELRSVNGKGLDLRFRLPARFEALEPAARHRLAQALKRGTIATSFEVQSGGAGSAYRINRAYLQELAALTKETAAAMGAAPPPLESLFAVKGVIEANEGGAGLGEGGLSEDAVLATLDQAVAALIEARRAEGARIGAILLGLTTDMQALAAQARELASLRPEKLKARLQEQLAALLDADRRLPEDKLAQELALLMVRFDVREELDRLDAHLSQVRAMLQAGDGEAVGRRLDFLAQELNREISTLCAKSSDAPLTRIGLDLKLAVDRFREQALNLE